MKFLFELVSKTQASLKATGLAICLLLASPLAAICMTIDPAGEAESYENTLWQPMHQSTNFGDCISSFPGEPSGILEEDMCVTQSFYNDCIYATAIMAEPFMDMPKDALSFIEFFKQNLDEEEPVPQIEVLSLNLPKLRYAVAVSFEEDGISFHYRYYCSEQGFGYIQLAVGAEENLLLHFFDTLKILK